MSDRLDQLDYYGLLSISREADAATVKKAFRIFARKYHPDRFTRSHPHKRDQATAIYRRGSEAFQVLSDPAARRLYDIALDQGIMRLTADQRDGAARFFELQRRPKAQSPSFSSPQAKALFEKATATMQQGNPRGAWKLLKNAEQIEPGNKLIHDALRTAERQLRGT